MVRKMMRKKSAIIPFTRHGIELSAIDTDAVNVVKSLQKAGFETYIVGGAVRDLLCGIKPKDFDISTAATPTEVKKLFRRARIIGRRFKLVHVITMRQRKQHFIEVATFRSGGDEVESDENGRIINDNIFGNAVDDATRRDFTCNALFYDPLSQNIIDYTNGYNDLRKQCIKIIGAPDGRFIQDPVRMLRLLRLQGKLNLTADKRTLTAVRDNAALIDNIDSGRLFDEVIKIVKSGAAANIFANCMRYGLLAHILPINQSFDSFVLPILQKTDERFLAGQKTSLSFVLASFFWTVVEPEWQRVCKDSAHCVQAMEKAIEVIRTVPNRIVPRRVLAYVIDLFFLQARMESPPAIRRAAGILRHPHCDRALAFMTLRGELGDDKAATLAKWWNDYRQANATQRRDMIAKIKPQIKPQ